ncbi:MAG: pyridoxamine 5'-phosphate oxidase family protein [Fibrobacterales bacterium]
MGQRFTEISDEHSKFIKEQMLFFVATAMHDGRVNLSPKGMDSFKVLGSNRVVWLNVTGSGNETATHVQHDSRMTIMFTSFTQQPLILRLYGAAKVVHSYDEEWKEYIEYFPKTAGSRQVFDVTIDLVQASCGMSIPFYEYQNERTLLTEWAEGKGEDGMNQYRNEKNQVSLDGHETHVIKK